MDKQKINLRLVHIKKIIDLPMLQWAEGLNFYLPDRIVQKLLPHKNITDIIPKLHIDTNSLNNLEGLAEKYMYFLRSWKAFTNNPPISGRLPINYQYIPSVLRDLFAHTVGRLQNFKQSLYPNFPLWPLDLSFDFLNDCNNTHNVSNQKTPVLLTHDIDSPEGLENLIRFFLDIEEELGARSCNFIVPCSWKIDYKKLDSIKSRGHEIGIHGYDHSNKTPFLQSTERSKRLLAALPLIKEYEIFGYRAPSLLRTTALLEDLEDLYSYDSSIPTSGGPFPIANNGCASARPFKIGNILEIPITLPRDGSLLYMGYSYEKIFNVWKHSANLISQSNGIINLLTHCEYRFSGRQKMREIYKRFLYYLANDGRFIFMLPKDILSYLKLS